MTAPEPSPDEYAVSPAIGPIPAIYVHLSPERTNTQRQHVSMGGSMSDIPAGLRYSKDHLWARAGAGTSVVRAGVTDFAQQSLGDVVDVTLPEPGDTVTAGEPPSAATTPALPTSPTPTATPGSSRRSATTHRKERSDERELELAPGHP